MVAHIILLALAGILLCACAGAPTPARPAIDASVPVSGDVGAPAPRLVAVYTIAPADRQSDGEGYIEIEYSPPVSDRAPIGGSFLVRIARRSIDHAASQWYRFEVTSGAESLLRKSGDQGIPNIRGDDGLWWSDVELDVNRPLPDEVVLAVEDRRIGRMFEFRLRRLWREAER